MDCVEKLRNCFDEMVVYKDLKKTNFFSALSLPSFMRDWLLKKFEDDEGYFDKDDLARFVKKYIPRKDDWTSIKNRIIIVGEKVKFLAKISIDINVRTGEVSFALPDFGLGYKDTIIESDVCDACKDDFPRDFLGSYSNTISKSSGERYPSSIIQTSLPLTKSSLHASHTSLSMIVSL